MHGKSDPLQEILSDSLSLILTSASAISSLISYMDGCSICCGNSDEKFLPLVEVRKEKLWMLRVFKYICNSVINVFIVITWHT